MEKRIRPWINKKIVEYIGEEEPTLVEFICSKIMAGSAAQSILDDVSMVRLCRPVFLTYSVILGIFFILIFFF